MSEPAWLGYTGAITGIVGAITGIAGAVMGYIAYRRSDQIKALDLRLELRKAETVLRSDTEELIPFLEQAQESHRAVAAAAGRTNSGMMQSWLAEFDEDVAMGSSFNAGLSAPSADYSALSHEELETKLVEVHVLHQKVKRLRDKYQASIAQNDRERENIRADMRVQTQSRRDGKP